MSTIKPLIWHWRSKKTENHNQQIAATPTVNNAMSMPIKLFSPADSGLRFVIPAAFLAEALLVAEAVLVMLPLGVPAVTRV